MKNNPVAALQLCQIQCVVGDPERLFRQKKLMVLVGVAFLACAVLLYVRIPSFRRAISPWILPPAGLEYPVSGVAPSGL